MLVVACGGVIGAMPVMAVVRRFTRRCRCTTRVRVPGVRVVRLGYPAVRLGRPDMLLRVVSMRMMIS
jgi:hypothetical protein